KSLILGKHQNNWQPLRSVPAPIEAERWHRLRVDMDGPTLRIFLDDAPAPLLEYTAPNNALPAGQVGIRTWNSDAAFRNLTITTNGQAVLSDTLTAEVSGVAVSGMWDAISTGDATAHYVWDSDDPYNSARSQQISYRAGTGTVGIANR